MEEAHIWTESYTVVQCYSIVVSYFFGLFHSVVGVFQEYRSEKSLEALTKLVPPKCHWYAMSSC